jgi:hypothetical protein
MLPPGFFHTCNVSSTVYFTIEMMRHNPFVSKTHFFYVRCEQNERVPPASRARPSLSHGKSEAIVRARFASLPAGALFLSSDAWKGARFRITIMPEIRPADASCFHQDVIVRPRLGA